MEVLSSVVAAIGATPLIELERISAGTGGRILAKLEYLNPGSSKKDRIARRIIESARQSGELRPGQVVVELTSGNTGAGAAIVCAVLKHPFIAVMSEGNSSERAQMMQALGATVVRVKQSKGSMPGQVTGEDLELVEAETDRLVKKLGGFRIDQFQRLANRDAHEFGTGPEIWEACGGQLTAFVDFVGSGGSFAGLYRYFKRRNPKVHGYVVEPTEAAILGTGRTVNPDHRIQGGGYSMKHLAQLEGIEPDGFLVVSDEEARAAAHRLAREEGIFGGYSSGANLAAALQLLNGPERGGTIAMTVCDSGLKYLSTDLWAEA